MLPLIKNGVEGVCESMVVVVVVGWGMKAHPDLY